MANEQTCFIVIKSSDNEKLYKILKEKEFILEDADENEFLDIKDGFYTGYGNDYSIDVGNDGIFISGFCKWNLVGFDHSLNTIKDVCKEGGIELKEIYGYEMDEFGEFYYAFIYPIPECFLKKIFCEEDEVDIDSLKKRFAKIYSGTANSEEKDGEINLQAYNEADYDGLPMDLLIAWIKGDKEIINDNEEYVEDNIDFFKNIKVLDVNEKDFHGEDLDYDLDGTILDD